MFLDPTPRSFFLEALRKKRLQSFKVSVPYDSRIGKNRTWGSSPGVPFPASPSATWHGDFLGKLSRLRLGQGCTCAPVYKHVSSDVSHQPLSGAYLAQVFLVSWTLKHGNTPFKAWQTSTAGDTDRSFSTTDMPKALTCTGITGGVSAWLAPWRSVRSR